MGKGLALSLYLPFVSAPLVVEQMRGAEPNPPFLPEERKKVTRTHARTRETESLVCVVCLRTSLDDGLAHSSRFVLEHSLTFVDVAVRRLRPFFSFSVSFFFVSSCCCCFLVKSFDSQKTLLRVFLFRTRRYSTARESEEVAIRCFGKKVVSTVKSFLSFTSVTHIGSLTDYLSCVGASE
jgi:hypothetical protein